MYHSMVIQMTLGSRIQSYLNPSHTVRTALSSDSCTATSPPLLHYNMLYSTVGYGRRLVAE